MNGHHLQNKIIQSYEKDINELGSRSGEEVSYERWLSIGLGWVCEERIIWTSYVMLGKGSVNTSIAQSSQPASSTILTNYPLRNNKT